SCRACVFYSFVALLLSFSVFSSSTPRHPKTTLFPYTTLFRSQQEREKQKKEKEEQRKLLLEQKRVAKENAKKAKLEAKKQKMLRSEEHTSELQSRFDLVCRLLLEKKKKDKHEQRRANDDQECA